MKRSGLSRSTLWRTLLGLEQATPPWITAKRRHRHATTYALVLDRLATGAMAKVPMRTYKSEFQIETQTAKSEFQIETQRGRSEFQIETQPPRSEFQIETPIPSTYVPRSRTSDPSAPPLRVGTRTHDDQDQNHEGESLEAASNGNTSIRPGAADVCANGRDGSRGADAVSVVADIRRGVDGADDRATPALGLPVRQGDDSQGNRRADAEPHQQTFGPLDVTGPQWGQIAQAFRTALQKPKAVDAVREETDQPVLTIREKISSGGSS